MNLDFRVTQIERNLSTLGYNDSLRAMDWMMEEMCKERGFERHNGDDYYFHLIDAAQDALDHGIREEPIITGILLHDSVEDIPGVTTKFIENQYGTRVAVSVDLVTKKPGIDYKIHENMVKYMLEIFNNRDSSVMKTSDRKHNFSTLREATPAKKLKQAIETETYYIKFLDDCAVKYPRYAGYFMSAKRSILPHLWAIKEHAEEIRLMQEENQKLRQQLGLAQ